MVKVLSVLKTGEPFRLASTDIFTLHSMKTGVKVDCYNALLKKTYRGKKSYDKLVSFIFDERNHKIIETTNDFILEHERRRAKELICLRFHRERCIPPPYEVVNLLERKSVSSDPEWGVKELVRVGKLALENLQTVGKFDRTRLSMLAFDLSNVLEWFDRRAKRAEGQVNGAQREKGPEAGSGPGV